jgi:hypothetical protein
MPYEMLRCSKEKRRATGAAKEHAKARSDGLYGGNT